MPYDEGVFYGVSEVAGVKVVSKVQLYVDLFNYPARGEEAAEIILKALRRSGLPRKAGNSLEALSLDFK